MKSLYLSLLASFIAMGSMHAQNFRWATKIGGTGYDAAVSVATDANGDVITTGYFRGTVDIDPGTNTTNITAAGDYDAFIQKLDASGNLVWAKQIGSTQTDNGLYVKTDASGNVYVMGAFRGTADFDPGPGTYNMTPSAPGYYDIFLLKLDASGNFVWAVQRQTSNPSDLYISGGKFTMDNNNNIYMAYAFSNNFSDQRATIITIEKTGNNGTAVWSKQINKAAGSSFSPYLLPPSIAVDASGNVFVSGSYLREIDFDPGGNFVLTTDGAQNGYILKLDNTGSFVWVKQLECNFPGFTNIYDITADLNGDIYTVGRFGGTADFDPNSGTNAQTSISSLGHSMFIWKLAASGNFAWMKQYGNGGNNVLNAVTTDAVGNVYTTGYFETHAYFTATPLSSVNNSGDIVTLKLDGNGAYIWAVQMGGASSESGYGIAVNNSGDVYTTGAFSSTVNFNYGGSSAFNLTSAGNSDCFLQRTAACPIIDTAVGLSGSTLTANASGIGILYQWMDCNTGSIIPGALNKTYSPAVTGNYAVIITAGNCSDTSACFATTGVGIHDIETQAINVSPNPTDGGLNIRLSKQYADVRVTITSQIGQLVSKSVHKNIAAIRTVLDAPAGVYFLTIHADGSIIGRSRVVKIK